jgi:hypothetical protein
MNMQLVKGNLCGMTGTLALNLLDTLNIGCICKQSTYLVGTISYDHNYPLRSRFSNSANAPLNEW